MAGQSMDEQENDTRVSSVGCLVLARCKEAFPCRRSVVCLLVPTKRCGW
jgi:hypothetical protein